MLKFLIHYKSRCIGVLSRSFKHKKASIDPGKKDWSSFFQPIYFVGTTKYLCIAFSLICLISCQKDHGLEGATLENDAFAQKYGLVAIDKKDIPKGIVPAQYESVREAEKFFGAIKRSPKTPNAEGYKIDSLAVLRTKVSAILPNESPIKKTFFEDKDLDGSRFVEFRGITKRAFIQVYEIVVFLEYRRYYDAGFYTRFREDVIVAGYGFGPKAYNITVITGNYFNGSDVVFSCNGVAYAMIGSTYYSFILDIEASGSCGTTRFGILNIRITG